MATRYFVGKVGQPLATFKEVSEVAFLAARAQARFSKDFTERNHSDGSSFSDGHNVQGIESTNGRDN